MAVKRPNVDGTPTLNLQQPFSHLGAIWIDSSRKSATCCACQQKIPGGTDRVNFQVRRSFVARFSNGGMTNQAKVLMHVSCLQDFLSQAKVPSSVGMCVDCFEPRAQAVMEYRHTKRGYLCDDCGKSGRWERCVMCAHYDKKYRMSRVALIEFVDKTGSSSWIEATKKTYACDACSRRDTGYSQFKTVKQLNKERKVEAALLATAEAIKQNPCLDLTDTP